MAVLLHPSSPQLVLGLLRGRLQVGRSKREFGGTMEADSQEAFDRAPKANELVLVVRARALDSDTAIGRHCALHHLQHGVLLGFFG